MNNNQIIDEINNAIGAHGTWKLKLGTAISHGNSETTPDIVKCDNLCVFGKWLHGPTISADTKLGMPYKVVTRLHAEFHVCAADVLRLALSKREIEAKSLMTGAFSEKSKTLVRALSKWKGELMVVAA